MATTSETVQISDEARAALEGVLQRMNADIDARNRRIQADKDLAAVNGVPYVGPEPQELMTFRDVVQLRLDQNVLNDIKAAVRQITSEWAELFISADAAARAGMMRDMAKYRKPLPR